MTAKPSPGDADWFRPASPDPDAPRAPVGPASDPAALPKGGGAVRPAARRRRRQPPAPARSVSRAGEHEGALERRRRRTTGGRRYETPPPDGPVVKIQSFTKIYDGFVAVKELDLEIDRGDIFGMIGPNGAGKTTTFRFLATLLQPTKGEAWIAGRSVRREVMDVRRLIGYMPDTFGVYDGMRVWEFLDFFALAYGIPRKKRVGLVGDVLALLDLEGKRDAPVTALSRGMKQRLCLAKTLVHDPPVLILDEPASGLDPRARLEIKELLRELQKMGKTILISSHILSELRDCCTKIAIMERGHLLASGPIEDIFARCGANLQVEIRVLSGEAEVEKLMSGDPRVSGFHRDADILRFEWTGKTEELADVHRDLVKRDVRVLWFREVERTLEEAFMTLTKGGGEVQ